MGALVRDSSSYQHEDVRATLHEFEGLLTKLGQVLHTDVQAGRNRGLAGAAAVAKPRQVATDGSIPAPNSMHEGCDPMSQHQPEEEAAGDDDPRTPYSGIHSIRDSTGGWRWIVSAGDTERKARSFPLDADEAAAKEADRVALLKCVEKSMLPHLNFPLCEYGASKDKNMARIVRGVLAHFMPLCKALPQSVQKQLADADKALAANPSIGKTAKRSRKADDQQPPRAQQKRSTIVKPPARRLAPSLQPADADADTSSEASDLPEGIVRSSKPQRPLKRLKRVHEMENASSQHIKENDDLPRSSATPQKPQQPAQPSVKVHAPAGTEKTGLCPTSHPGTQKHEEGDWPDGGTQQASKRSSGQTVTHARQTPVPASMQANGAEAPAAKHSTAVDREEGGQAAGGGEGHQEMQSKQPHSVAPGIVRTPKKKRVKEQASELMESSKRRKLEPVRPPGAPDIPARVRPTMQSLLFASRPVRPLSAQADPSVAAASKPECPACGPLAEAATSAGQPEVGCQPPEQTADLREAGSADGLSEAPKLTGDSTPAKSGQHVKPEPTGDVNHSESAQGKAAADGISMKLGSLQRPNQPDGSAPSSRQYIFMGRGAETSAGSPRARGVQQAASNIASARDVNAGEDTEWSTDGQQSTDQADAHADIHLGSSGIGPDAAASAQPPVHSKDSRGKPSRLQKAGAADHAEEGGAAGEPLAPVEHQRESHAEEAAFSSPPPPVRTLEDDLAEQGLPGRNAATAAAQRMKVEPPVASPRQHMPGHSLQPDQPGQKVTAERFVQQAQAIPGDEAGPSGASVNGAMPEGHRAAGTVTDPVVISDSDSSDDELEEPCGVKHASATMPGIPGRGVNHATRGSLPQQRPGSLRSPVGIGAAAKQATAGRRLFSARRNTGAMPAIPQPAAAAPNRATAQPAQAQPVQQQAYADLGEKGERPTASGAAYHPTGAWPPSAGAQDPPQMAQAAAAAAADAYREALRQPSGAQSRQKSRARSAAWLAQTRRAGPKPSVQPQARPTAFVDLDSSSDASSSSMHGAAVPQPAGMQEPEQARMQKPPPDSSQAEDGATSPLPGRSLGAYRRPPAATGSIFRPVPPVPRYLKRTSAAQPAPSSQAAAEAVPVGTANAASVPEAHQAGAAPSHAAADTSELSPSRLTLERDREALAEADAAEWQARRAEIEKQAEEARREKQRRKAQAEREGERARRSQARLEDHRRLKAEQEAQQDEREVVRQQVREQLEARVRWLRAPDAILRALGVPLEMVPGNPFRADLPRTVRKARLTYHPDRHQGRSLKAQVEAEEIFKMLALVKT